MGRNNVPSLLNLDIDGVCHRGFQNQTNQNDARINEEKKRTVPPSSISNDAGVSSSLIRFPSYKSLFGISTYKEKEKGQLAPNQQVKHMNGKKNIISFTVIEDTPRT